MRANLNDLAKIVRPVSAERSHELAVSSADEDGSGFVAVESEFRDEFWAEAVAQQQPRYVAFG